MHLSKSSENQLEFLVQQFKYMYLSKAISTGADMIALGKLDTVVAGGVEFLSDPPIKLPRHTRKWFMQLNRAKSAGIYIQFNVK